MGLVGALAACGTGQDDAPRNDDPVPVEDGAGEMSVSIDPADGTRIELVAATAHEIKFSSNPTTGYFWTCEVDAGGSVEITGDIYIADPAPEGLVGRGGTQVFTLHVGDAGSAGITCAYARSPDDVIDRRKLAVFVFHPGDFQ